MQRTLQIFINNLFYKEITVAADDKGNYNLIEVFAIIDKDKNEGLLADLIPPNGQMSVRVKYHL